jgi:hypothetical protein
MFIQGAANGESTLVENVGVDHGSSDVTVAQQLLDGANVITAFKKLRVTDK